MSRRKWFLPGCAFLLVLLAGSLIAVGPTALALRLAGFRAQGRTADFVEKQAEIPHPTLQWPGRPGAAASPSVTPVPPGAGAAAPDDGNSLPAQQTPGAALPLDKVKVDSWFLPQPETWLASQIFADRLERGWTEAGRLAYYIEFSEQGANAFLNHWLSSYVAEQARIRDPWIDFTSGGVVVHAELNLEVGWQRVGAVLMLDASGRQFTVAGVDIDGRFYSVPPEGPVADLTQQLESEGNRALRELVFLDAAGELRIRQISVSQDGAQILAY